MKKRTIYTVRIDGVGFTIQNREIFKLQCCDCGLVHQVVIVAPDMEKGTPLGFAATRDNRATSQRRRKR